MIISSIFSPYLNRICRFAQGNSAFIFPRECSKKLLKTLRGVVYFIGKIEKR